MGRKGQGMRFFPSLNSTERMPPVSCMDELKQNETVTVRVFFLLPPQVHLLDINGPAHIFYEAREMGADIKLYYISLTDQQEVESSAGLVFSQLTFYGNYVLGATDWIFIPGLDKRTIDSFESTGETGSFYEWLQVQHGNGAKICSVCTGAYLVAQSGLLSGRQCTTHWKYLDDFSSSFPGVILHKDRLFVKDENIYSSAGVSSGIDLALFIVEEVYGPALAAKVAKEMVIYLRRTENDPQLSMFLQYRNHMHDRIHQVQDLLAQHLSQGMKIEELAACVCMSPRNLTRLFKKATGITIGKYQDKLRIERAVTLLGEGQKVETVANGCGFSGANQLREMLKKQVGVLPTDLMPSGKL